MSAPVLVGPSPSGGGPVPSLTPRQGEVLRLASNGRSYFEIGRAMGIAEKTVSSFMTQIFQRLGARNLPHAVLLGCQAGLLDGRPQRHGDHAGFAAHERRGEDPWGCTACAEGERAYRRGRRAARKEGGRCDSA